MSPGIPGVLPVAPWGGLLGIYFVLVGAAAGTGLVSHLIRPETQANADLYRRRAALLVLGLLGACAVILIADLGRPERFGLMLTRFAPASVMSWGAKLLLLEALLLGALIYLLGRRLAGDAAGRMTPPDGATKAVFAAAEGLLLATSVALAAYPAVLLAQTWSSPLMRSGLAGAGFIVSAALLGTAACLLLAHSAGDPTLFGRLRRTLWALLVLQGALLLGFLVPASSNAPTFARAASALVSGQFAPAFWGGALGLGVALPLLGLAFARSHRHSSTAVAALVLVGTSAARYLLFVVHA